LKSLSTQGRAVLDALVGDDAPVAVAVVLGDVHRPGVSLPVARASLSRTLRRLWAGLVELLTAHATRPTLTDQAAYWRTCYATMQAAPEAHYQAYRRSLQPPAEDDFGSATAYVEAFRAATVRPFARCVRCPLRRQGRAAVNKASRGELIST